MSFLLDSEWSFAVHKSGNNVRQPARVCSEIINSCGKVAETAKQDKSTVGLLLCFRHGKTGRAGKTFNYNRRPVVIGYKRCGYQPYS